jgi:hypothetical protein
MQKQKEFVIPAVLDDWTSAQAAAEKEFEALLAATLRALQAMPPGQDDCGAEEKSYPRTIR